jgi:hypothetical protein
MRLRDYLRFSPGPGKRAVSRAARLVGGVLIALADTSPALEALPYPEGPLTADQIAEQVHATARGNLVRNAVSKGNETAVPLVVNRAPIDSRGGGRKPNVQTFDTYVNNGPQDPTLDSLQMAILTSGKAKGTAVLFTRYADKTRGSIISMWLPALRKVRRINEPSYEDVWFGTNLTYEEIALRRPEDETHELLGEGTFEDCLPAMELDEAEKDRFTKELPGPQCGHKGKPVYRLKSTTRFKNWWYDHHLSEIDKKTFSLYRTVYFKNGEKVKTVVIDWQSLDQPDPRVNYPRYVYAVSHADGKDSMIHVPRSTITLNVDLPDSFWSEKTMQEYAP